MGWLGVFDEAAVVAPFLLAAPLVFADEPERWISLGTLMQFSNVCGHVFDAMTTVANSYPELNAFAAVAVRLREFEQAQARATEADAVLLTQRHVEVELAPAQPPREEPGAV